eukprot:UC4_evm5s379
MPKPMYHTGGVGLNPRVTEVAVAQYSTKTTIFADFQSPSLSLSAIDTLEASQDGKSTATGIALDSVRQRLSWSTSARRIVVLTSDGESHPDNPPQDAARRLRDAGVEIIGVAIRQGASVAELEAIAGPHGRVFFVESPADLSSIVDKVTSFLTCSISPPTATPTPTPTLTPTTLSPTTTTPTSVAPTSNPTSSPTTLSPTPIPTASPTTLEGTDACTEVQFEYCSPASFWQVFRYPNASACIESLDSIIESTAEDTCSSVVDTWSTHSTLSDSSMISNTQMFASKDECESFIAKKICNRRGDVCDITHPSVSFASSLAALGSRKKLCRAFFTERLGDGICDSSYNTESCDWDHGDCCVSTCSGAGCHDLDTFSCRNPNACENDICCSSPDGTPCDDGNPDTTEDQCFGRTCSGIDFSTVSCGDGTVLNRDERVCILSGSTSGMILSLTESKKTLEADVSQLIAEKTAVQTSYRVLSGIHKDLELSYDNLLFEKAFMDNMHSTELDVRDRQAMAEINSKNIFISRQEDEIKKLKRDITEYQRNIKGLESEQGVLKTEKEELRRELQATKELLDNERKITQKLREDIVLKQMNSKSRIQTLESLNNETKRKLTSDNRALELHLSMKIQALEIEIVNTNITCKQSIKRAEIAHREVLEKNNKKLTDQNKLCEEEISAEKTKYAIMAKNCDREKSAIKEKNVVKIANITNMHEKNIAQEKAECAIEAQTVAKEQKQKESDIEKKHTQKIADLQAQHILHVAESVRNATRAEKEYCDIGYLHLFREKSNCESLSRNISRKLSDTRLKHEEILQGTIANFTSTINGLNSQLLTTRESMKREQIAFEKRERDAYQRHQKEIVELENLQAEITVDCKRREMENKNEILLKEKSHDRALAEAMANHASEISILIENHQEFKKKLLIQQNSITQNKTLCAEQNSKLFSENEDLRQELKSKEKIFDGQVNALKIEASRAKKSHEKAIESLKNDKDIEIMNLERIVNARNLDIESANKLHLQEIQTLKNTINQAQVSCTEEILSRERALELQTKKATTTCAQNRTVIVQYYEEKLALQALQADRDINALLKASSASDEDNAAQLFEVTKRVSMLESQLASTNFNLNKAKDKILVERETCQQQIILNDDKNDIKCKYAIDEEKEVCAQKISAKQGEVSNLENSLQNSMETCSAQISKTIDLLDGDCTLRVEDALLVAYARNEKDLDLKIKSKQLFTANSVKQMVYDQNQEVEKRMIEHNTEIMSLEREIKTLNESLVSLRSQVRPENFLVESNSCNRQVAALSKAYADNVKQIDTIHSSEMEAKKFHIEYLESELKYLREKCGNSQILEKSDVECGIEKKKLEYQLASIQTQLNETQEQFNSAKNGYSDCQLKFKTVESENVKLARELKTTNANWVAQLNSVTAQFMEQSVTCNCRIQDEELSSITQIVEHYNNCKWNIFQILIRSYIK